jgi:hypothetical protein
MFLFRQLSFLIPVLAILSLGGSVSAQIVVTGTVRVADIPAAALSELMIVNLHSQNGIFGRSDGSFRTVIGRTDTLLIGSTGYASEKICFADSLPLDSFYVEVNLHRLSVQLKEVRIFSPRDLEEIEKDIRKLGYNKDDYELSGVNALESPITFLYQQFSRLEQLKRHNRERINDDKRRKLLKELLHRYVAWEIIDLDDDEFDSFIDFCNVSEAFMKQSTQYDFIEYIKGRFMVFEALKK